jgi:hypothetical protein
VLLAHMLHQLRVAKPAISDHQRRGQLQAPAPKSQQPLIEHRPCPAQFITTRSPRPNGIGPPNGKVHRHDQAPIPNDHHQQEAINARQHALVLAAPPGAHESQLLPIFFEYTVIGDPGPLPATAGGGTLVLDMAPQRDEHLQPQASEPLEPGALGQRPKNLWRQVLVPAAHAREFGGSATAKE